MVRRQVFLALLSIVLVAFTIGAGERLAASPLLIQWMDLSFVDSDELAGYGYYTPGSLDTPNLYWTHGAVEILTALCSPIERWEPIVEHIQSLQQSDGTFDDPTTDAPAFIETRWAVRVLRALDQQPQEPSTVRQALLDSLARLDIDPNSINGSLSMRLSEAMVTVQALEVLIGTDETAAQPEVGRVCTIAKVVLANSDRELERFSPWDFGTMFDVLWLSTRLVAGIDPEGISDAAVRFLDRHAQNLNCAPADFVGVSLVSALLEMLAEMHGWESIPEEIRSDAQSYLQLRVFPEIADIGGFGWSNAWGSGSIDARMNIDLVRLCAMIGLEYPNADQLIHAFERVRISNGWASLDLTTPSSHSTHDALAVLQWTGLPTPSPDKIRAFLQTFFESSDASLRDLHEAAMGRLILGEQEGDVGREILMALRRRSDQELAQEADWLGLLLLRFALYPDTKAMFDVLTVRSEELADAVRQTPFPRMEMLYSLAILGTVLGQDVDQREALVDEMLCLKADGGGFRAVQISPVADTVSTYQAIEALSLLGAGELIPSQMCRRFAESCFLSPGYLFAPAEELIAIEEDLYMDLGTTATTVRLLQVLDRLDATASQT